MYLSFYRLNDRTRPLILLSMRRWRNCSRLIHASDRDCPWKLQWNFVCPISIYSEALFRDIPFILRNEILQWNFISLLENIHDKISFIWILSAGMKL